jgi:hypothetical protein
VRAKHEIRMAGEPTVGPDRALVHRRWPDLLDIEPGLVAFRFADLTLAEE